MAFGGPAAGVAPFDDALWENGPRPGGFYQMRPVTARPADGPRTHTRQPIVTGTSVLGIRCSDGVVMAADTLGSYGSLARFRDVERLCPVGDRAIVGGSGDIADFHALKHMMEDLVTENIEWSDGHPIEPRSVHTYLTRVMYGRRSKMNPLWNTLVVGGFSDGQGYLGYVDKVGVAYTDPTIATGYGAYIALPLMRDAVERNPEITCAEAKIVLERCLKVMYYRDARSLNRYQIATATAEGVSVSEPQTAETNWDIAEFVKGYE
mmetsp:Transcript_31794/g.95551  ORF Transcript_31794/g.95551 Transcript_31794/m.95551 type:complete len:264 (+) Transcript_31794:756-1547(+)